MKLLIYFLHDANATNLSSIMSTSSTPLKHQLDTCLDDVQATVASLVEQPRHKRGRSKIEHPATHVRQNDSLPRRDKRVPVRRGPTIGEGGDRTISSPGRSPKQPLPEIGLHDPLHGRLAPNSSHLIRGLVKYVPGRGYFHAVSSQNGDKFVTSSPPPNR